MTTKIKCNLQAFLFHLILAAPLLGLQSCQSNRISAVSPARGLLLRRYQPGERIIYRMTATNWTFVAAGPFNIPVSGRRYEIQAHGRVINQPDGKSIEEFAWSDLIFNNNPRALSGESATFRQRLSLARGFALGVPDLSRVDPSLVGPITDLLTFYADWQVASGQSALKKPGDHAVVKLNLVPSWADGTRVILGQDSFNFDITLTKMNARDQTATFLVRHIPPDNPMITIPADWMRQKVADTPNNWIQVKRNPDGTYSAMVGKETFDVEMKIDLRTGKIISGTIDNPLDVVALDCKDAALTKVGNPTRLKIERKIEIHSISEP